MVISVLDLGREKAEKYNIPDAPLHLKNVLTFWHLGSVRQSNYFFGKLMIGKKTFFAYRYSRSRRILMVTGGARLHVVYK